jgi:cytochrome oxidase Cu insertion factor (SCO1/SenC/PrrC family)
MNRAPTALIVLALLLAILAGGLLWYIGEGSPGATSSGTGVADIGGPFALIDQNGLRRTDSDFHGHYVLLYFGYSYCPDVCPTTLGVMADALAKLGPRASRIVPVFITIDPERDTPAVLKKYLAAFGPNFVGLTGSLADITRAAHEYRVYFAKHKLESGGYAVDHSSVIYLLGPDGKLLKFYDAAETPDQLVKDLSAVR